MNAARTRPRRLSHRITGIRFAHAAVVAVILLAGVFTAAFVPTGTEWEGLIYPACLGLVLLSVWMIWSWRAITGQLFEPYVLFLLSAITFNGGQAFLEVLHLNPNGLLDGRFSAETTAKTLILVTLGLGCFHMGALLAIRKRRGLLVGGGGAGNAPTARDIRRIGWMLLFVSAVPAALVLKDAISVVMSSGYLALYQREIRTGLGASDSILAGFLVPATLFLLAGSKEKRLLRVMSTVIILAYAAAQLFVGSRARAAMPVLAYLWLWHVHIRPLRPSVLTGIGAAMVGVLFPLVRAVRHVSGGERLSFSFLSEAFLSIENPLIASISEMGGTMSTIAYTLELVPRVREFDMGIGYLYGFLTVIPSIFWDLHPTATRGFASHWLVWTVAPRFAAAGGGLGYSFIAEAYLNFGWYGAPLLLGVLGYGFARIARWGTSGVEPARLATVASWLAFVLFFARAESASEIRALVWYSVIPYVGVRLLSASRMRARWVGRARPPKAVPVDSRSTRAAGMGGTLEGAKTASLAVGRGVDEDSPEWPSGPR